MPHVHDILLKEEVAVLNRQVTAKVHVSFTSELDDMITKGSSSESGLTIITKCYLHVSRGLPAKQVEIHK